MDMTKAHVETIKNILAKLDGGEIPIQFHEEITDVLLDALSSWNRGVLTTTGVEFLADGSITITTD